MAKKSKKQRERARKRAASSAPAPAMESKATAEEHVSEVRLMTPPAPVAVADEHRASKRISLAVELHLASESHFFSGLSGDISEGGVFVSTYRALAMGSLVDVEFSLPGSERTIHARGEVRWHRDASPGATPGVGIAFDELAEEDRSVIHRFCTMRPPLYYDDVG
ncbi:MAG: hypothetical protein JWP87_5601 [Labilithrix sp.]|nr:hypothetical protein [Labilithrix sp.]